MSPAQSPDRTLKARVVDRTMDLLHEAGSWLCLALPEPEVRFDLRGRAAGQARFGGPRPGTGSWLIRYNPALLAANADDFLAETVPHEVAHLAAFARHGTRIRPHGPEWRAIVRRLGGVGERCHRYDLASAPVRELCRFDYHCGCRNHRLSSIRHRRVLAGQVYVCRSCAGPLRPGHDALLGAPAESGPGD
jgi:SprT protein